MPYLSVRAVTVFIMIALVSNAQSTHPEQGRVHVILLSTLGFPLPPGHLSIRAEKGDLDNRAALRIVGAQQSLRRIVAKTPAIRSVITTARSAVHRRTSQKN